MGADVGVDVVDARAMSGARGRVSPERAEALAIVGLAVVAAAFIWFVARPHGLAVSSDSVAYLGTADSWRQGHGAGYVLQRPLTTWPLLYPGLLAAISTLTGLRGLDAAIVVAMAGAAGLVVAMWRLTIRVITRRWVRLATVIAAVLAPATLTVEWSLLTDAIFCSGTVALVVIIMNMVDPDRRNVRWMVVGVVTVWLLFLTRYAGIGFAPVVSIVLLMVPRARPLGRRVRDAVAFGVAALVVPIGYFIRNHLIAGDLDQISVESRLDAVRSLTSVPATFGTWVSSRLGSSRSLVALGVITLVGLTLVAAWFIRTSWLASDPRASGAQVTTGPEVGRRDMTTSRAVVAWFWVGTIVFLVVLRVVLVYSLEARTMAMLLPLSIALAAAAVDQGLQAERPAVRTVLATAMAGWIVVMAVLGVRAALLYRRNGSGFLGGAYTALYAELRGPEVTAAIASGCTVRSNQPNLLWVSGLDSTYAPRTSDTTDPKRSGTSAGGPTCIVWVDQGPIAVTDLVPIDQLRTDRHLTPTFTGAHVVVYTGTL